MVLTAKEAVIVVGADGNPAVLGGDVVDAVGLAFASVLSMKVVDLDVFRVAGRVPFPSAVLELTDQFLFLVSTDTTRHHRPCGPGPGR